MLTHSSRRRPSRSRERKHGTHLTEDGTKPSARWMQRARNKANFRDESAGTEDPLWRTNPVSDGVPCETKPIAAGRDGRQLLSTKRVTRIIPSRQGWKTKPIPGKGRDASGCWCAWHTLRDAVGHGKGAIGLQEAAAGGIGRGVLNLVALGLWGRYNTPAL
jgi:hypothetical protein